MIMRIFICYISIIVSILLPINVFSQPNTVNKILPKDPLEFPGKRQIDNSILRSFLIEENVYYDFLINNIIELEKGYWIEVNTKIDSFEVWAHIITDKINIHKKNEYMGEKIKTGKNYQFSLKRYFLYPQISGIGGGNILDVMLGNNTILIESSGAFTYLFTSLDIDGLYVKDSSFAKIKTGNFEKNKQKIMETVCPFVNLITYKKDTNYFANYWDTISLIHSLCQYGDYMFSRHPSELSVLPKPKIELFDWQDFYEINPNQFNEIFWCMLKEDYKLPKDTSLYQSDIECDSIQTDLLYYSKDGIYTIRVRWKIPITEQPYIIVINVQEQEDSIFKVIGFNKDDFAYTPYYTCPRYYK
jgi:hypothetical protein